MALQNRLKSWWLSHWGQYALMVVILMGGAIAYLTPMLAQGYPITHSTHFNLSWVFQYQAQFFGGQVYPRWLEYSNLGLGNATFAFYPPLWVAATLPWGALGVGVDGAGIGSMGAALLVLGMGLYVYGRLFF